MEIIQIRGLDQKDYPQYDPGASTTTGIDPDYERRVGIDALGKANEITYYLTGHLLKSVAWAQADLGAYDLVVLLTAHPEFDPARLVREARLALDTRNATGALGDVRHVIRI
jgi:hypothetical protein